jgi:hypothetical protein
MNTTTSIRLSQVAPWNSGLRNPYRTRWAQVGDRMFKVYADCLDGVWFVEEVDHDGEQLHHGRGLAPEDWYGSLGFAFTLTEARKMIAEAVA